MNEPLISVLVPVCNVEKYLSECLDSIVGQTFKDMEIICLNDGSTDRSGEILRAFSKKDARIRVVEKPNTGYGHTMNLGLDMARGKYIGIVESDDFVELDMFEKLYRLAELHQTEVVKSDYYMFTDREEVIHSDYDEHVYGKIFVPREKENHSVFLVHWSIWCGLYRRDFLLKNEIRFNETPGASYQDTAFMFKIWSYTERAYITKEPLLHYRRGNPEASSHAISKVFCFCDEYEEVERFLEANPAFKEKVIIPAMTRKYRDYLTNFNMLAAAYQYVFLLRMEKELRRDAALAYLHPDGFKEKQWEALQLLLEDREAFFESKAKDFRDTRLQMCSSQNQGMYEEMFGMYLRKFRNVIVFGAGILGKRMGEWILRKGRKDIFCFAVTSLEKNPVGLFGVPVKEADALAPYTQDALVVLAIRERDQFEAFKMLEKIGFRNIILLDMTLRYIIKN